MNLSVGKVIACLGLSMLAVVSHAQSYPNRPVRFVISFPPGAGPDVFARTLSPKLSEKWGQQAIIDNRPGGGGNIATELVARAAADGYTVVVLSNHFTINPSLFRKVPYDPVKDFAPVILATWTPTVLLVHPSLPVKTVKEFLAFAKPRSGELNYASGGNGSVAHMAGALLEAMTGIRFVHVPYRGPAESSTALVSGQVPFAFATAPQALTYVRSGRLRALGASKRVAAAPDWPLIEESGVPGFDIVAWQGILAPSATPPAVVNTLNADIGAVLKNDEIKERLTRQGLEIIGGTSADFAQFLATELVKWKEVVKKTGATVD